MKCPLQCTEFTRPLHTIKWVILLDITMIKGKIKKMLNPYFGVAAFSQNLVMTFEGGMTEESKWVESLSAPTSKGLLVS